MEWPLISLPSCFFHTPTLRLCCPSLGIWVVQMTLGKLGSRETWEGLWLSPLGSKLAIFMTGMPCIGQEARRLKVILKQGTDHPRRSDCVSAYCVLAYSDLNKMFFHHRRHVLLYLHPRVGISCTNSFLTSYISASWSLYYPRGLCLTPSIASEPISWPFWPNSAICNQSNVSVSPSQANVTCTRKHSMAAQPLHVPL